MVEGPAVTLGDDHAPAVRIDALEMFVDLLARVEEDGSSEEFYGRLCEAACSLTSMERAVLFRYDETQRRVRAAGSHNIPLDVFAGTHLTVETAPIAREALVEDRVLDVAREPRPRAARALPLAAARRAARVHADRRQRALDRRDPLRPPRPDAADRQRALPAVDDRQGRRARHPRADRHPQPGAGQAAAGAHRPRARDPRGRDPAAVRRVDGVLGRPGAVRRGARAHRRGAQRRAEGPAHGARAPAGADGAADADDVRRGVRAARRRASGARACRWTRSCGCRRRSSRSRSRC